MTKRISAFMIAVSIFFVVSGAQAFPLEVSANPTTIAVAGTVSFTCTPKGGSPPYTYAWDFDDVDSYKTPIMEQNPSHQFNWAGTHYVTVSVKDSTSEEESSLLIVDVQLSASTTTVDAVTDCGLDNTGGNDCRSALRICISNNYSTTGGLKIEFPPGIYRFDEADYATEANARYCGIPIDARGGERKIALVAKNMSERPILRFHNDRDMANPDRSWDAFIYVYGLSSTEKVDTHILLQGLILENDLSAQGGSLENFDVQRCIGGTDGYAYRSYTRIERCDIKNFTTIGNLSRGMVKKCNVSGFGKFNGGRIEALRLSASSLCKHSYFYQGATGHSKIWYFTNVPNTYIIENYADSSNADINQYHASLKSAMSDGKMEGNMIRNAPGTCIAMGSYDDHANNFDIINNRILGCGGSGISMHAGSNVDIIGNFFVDTGSHPCFAIGDNSKCLFMGGMANNTFKHNVAGYGAPGGSHGMFLCQIDDENECTPPATCGLVLSENTDNDEKFLASDPPGWRDENGYIDPGPWEYAPPTNCSVSVQEGGSGTLGLSLSAADQDSGMGPAARFPHKEGGLVQLSNDGVSWSEVRPYGEIAAWMAADGEGAKTVYARFRDRGGNWGQSVSVTIERPLPPTGLEVIEKEQ